MGDRFPAGGQWEAVSAVAGFCSGQLRFVPGPIDHVPHQMHAVAVEFELEL
jgi:hypothetical protein